MFRLEFLDPSGGALATKLHAPRLDSLGRKKIGFISIEEWQAYRTFPLLRDLLQSDFPDVEVLPLEALPRGIASIALEETADRVAASGVDAVIIGNAA